ncbi:hypothetical protein Trydic_g1756 [Trypoxylus dichotomus]
MGDNSEDDDSEEENYVDLAPEINVPNNMFETVDVGNPGQFTGTVLKADDPNMYKYVVSVIVNDHKMGVGTYVKPAIVLTTFCFFDGNITKFHKVKVATWESTKTNEKGEVIDIIEMLIHPNFDDASCNYDVVLLKMDQPFDGVEEITVDRDVTVPKHDTACISVASYEGNIFIKNLTVKRLDSCQQHAEYKKFEMCSQQSDLICVELAERVFGAPVICDFKLIGILPSNIDIDQNLTVVQFLPSYYQWVQRTAGPLKRSRASTTFYEMQLIFIIFILWL